MSLTIFPFSNCITLLGNNFIISLSCVAIITVTPSLFISFNIFNIPIEFSLSKFPVHSSAIIIDGLFTIALAIATL